MLSSSVLRSLLFARIEGKRRLFDLKNTVVGRLAIAIIAAATFFVLADLAEYWGGGLFPNPLWLATASTTAVALLVAPRFRVAAIFGGALDCIAAGLILFDDSVRSLATPCLGNTAESAIAISLFPRALTTEVSFGRTRRAVAWLGVSLVAAAVGGAIATADTSSQVIDERLESLLRWTIGDLVGLLLLPPLVVAFRSPWIAPRYRRWYLEAIFSFAALVALLAVAFSSDNPLPYVLVPVVMWIAIRFGPRLASPAALLTAMAATYLTSEGHGPFATLGSNAVLQVQILNIAVAASALIASAHAVRAWHDQQRVRVVLEALPDVIVTMANDGYLEGAWGPAELQRMVADLRPERRQPGSGPPTAPAITATQGPILVHASGLRFEHRAAAIDRRLTMHVFRDVTTEQQVADLRRSLETQIDETRFAERQRLARDLHDGPLQSVAAARLFLETAALSSVHEPALIAKAEEAMTQSAMQLRNSLGGLVTVDEDIGPIEALALFGEDVLKTTGTDFAIHDTTKHETLDRATQDALLLIGREAVLNAASHSGATKVTIDLRSDDAHVELRVTDNGRGVSPASRSDRVHLGIATMSSRASELGGRLEIDSDHNAGTVVRAVLPISGLTH